MRVIWTSSLVEIIGDEVQILKSYVGPREKVIRNIETYFKRQYLKAYNVRCNLSQSVEDAWDDGFEVPTRFGLTTRAYLQLNQASLLYDPKE